MHTARLIGQLDHECAYSTGILHGISILVEISAFTSLAGWSGAGEAIIGQVKPFAAQSKGVGSRKRGARDPLVLNVDATGKAGVLVPFRAAPGQELDGVRS